MVKVRTALMGAKDAAAGVDGAMLAAGDAGFLRVLLPDVALR